MEFVAQGSEFVQNGMRIPQKDLGKKFSHSLPEALNSNSCRACTRPRTREDGFETVGVQNRISLRSSLHLPRSTCDLGLSIVRVQTTEQHRSLCVWACAFEPPVPNHSHRSGASRSAESSISSARGACSAGGGPCSAGASSQRRTGARVMLHGGSSLSARASSSAATPLPPSAKILLLPVVSIATRPRRTYL